ncbi:MAG: anhydro-N-acetylmuramic acid kinase [Gemmatimonadales bacterium]|nr:anhydro-N-acetylmuramic acid kinase [Gemmatimonadales bacterium]
MTAETPAARGDVLVGLMSGTSLDGITAVVVRFVPDADGGVTPQLLAQVARPYDAATRARLTAALEGATPSEYTRLDFALGGWLAEAAIAALAESGVPREEVRAICSHGHTVWHEPPHGTWQFGQPAVIAERTGIDVLADFRVRDVAAGGQGAPLVPIADALLFSRPKAWRVLQNLGGIGNLTLVPPGGALEAVRAFDTGPGVCIIDGVTRALRPALPYDRDGALAAVGTPVESVLEALLADPWYAAEPPKSTGRERYTSAFIADFIARCRAARAGCTDQDVVATATWFTARSIALAFERFVPQPVEDVLLSGGGTRNPVLREAIAMALAPRIVRPFEQLYFDGEAKEAVAFAFLGWLHLHGRAANVPAATGARGPRVLGARFPA